jgi:phosphoribosyl 1,2-cyclic phosphodiesterase
MGFYFRSLCSSSAGNSLVLWGEKTRLLVDCGISSQRDCRAMLAKEFPNPGDLDAVIVTHAHGDHINYSTLKVFGQNNIPVRIHEKAIGQVENKWCVGHKLPGLRMATFGREFQIGEFAIEAVKLEHMPLYHTVGFVVHWMREGRSAKAVIMADFCEWENIAEHFRDADFIYVEANHDLKMLRENYNPNSEYHLPNPQTGNLLHTAAMRSAKQPATVMLGHISSQRNKAKLALAEVKKTFAAKNDKMDFRLLAAPLYETSEVVTIAD